MTPAGIERATFRFVAQRLNHCATAVPTCPMYRALIRLKFITKSNERTWIYECILLHIDHRQFQVVRYIIAHQSGPQSTTHTFYIYHSTKAYHRQQFLTSNILYSSLFYQLTVIFTKNYTIFNCALISTHYKCTPIFVLTTHKMATWAAETCRWSLCLGSYY